MQGYHEAGLPPFRTTPDYDQVSRNKDNAYQFFPAEDYILEFGAGDYFIRVGKRSEAVIQPVEADVVTRFCRKGIADSGEIDPSVLRHLIRNAKDNFKRSNTSTESFLQTNASLLVTSLIDYANLLQPHSKQAAPESTDDKITLMMKHSMWYQQLSPGDQRKVASAYLDVPKIHEQEKQTSERVKRIYRAAALILPKLPEPQLIWDECKNKDLLTTQNIEIEGLDQVLSDMRSADFRGITHRLLRNPGAINRIAHCLESLIADLDPNSVDETALRKAVFGPRGSVLLCLRSRENEEKPQLTNKPLLKDAIDRGKMELVTRLSDEQFSRLYQNMLSEVKGSAGKGSAVQGSSEYRFLIKSRLTGIRH